MNKMIIIHEEKGFAARLLVTDPVFISLPINYKQMSFT